MGLLSLFVGVPEPSCFYFFGGPGTVPDVGSSKRTHIRNVKRRKNPRQERQKKDNNRAALVPQTSSQYGNALDVNDLRVELLKEKALREKAENELQQQKSIAADLTNKVQYAFFMMLQMQESYRLSNYKEVLTMENTQLKKKIEQLEKENAKLAKELESGNEQDATSVQKEEDMAGFDVNEMYGTKNELLLMALNYDMTSRQSPEGFHSHS
ncbi:hypothetical protein ANCCAN_23815 [Ancylostoma caninum]|uniref:Uncharacterized protein n=1 Tax=Ancylostoma caninum TaxID=29170 RepID=A0A368FED4_ANCCA|nr:hypothetical protein ANCCAN_23815 [Ancylostoma caninum]